MPGQFDFRFNDVTADVPKEIETRRSVPIPSFGTKTTYNVKIPMEQTLVFGVPPCVRGKYLHYLGRFLHHQRVALESTFFSHRR
jgi:hypothetical protein